MRKLEPSAGPSKRKNRLRSALICASIVVTASGCGHAPAGTLAQLCSENGWREIGVRKGDVITDPTAREIIGNNEARTVWCNSARKKA